MLEVGVFAPAPLNVPQAVCAPAVWSYSSPWLLLVILVLYSQSSDEALELNLEDLAFQITKHVLSFIIVANLVLSAAFEALCEVIGEKIETNLIVGHLITWQKAGGSL